MFGVICVRGVDNVSALELEYKQICEQEHVLCLCVSRVSARVAHWRAPLRGPARLRAWCCGGARPAGCGGAMDALPNAPEIGPEL